LRAAFSGQGRISYTILVALRPCQRLGLLQRLFAGENVRPQAPRQHVIKVEEYRCPAIRQADLAAAGLRHGFMPDDMDRSGPASKPIQRVVLPVLDFDAAIRVLDHPLFGLSCAHFVAPRFYIIANHLITN
jgi:hypothetical protein